MFQRLSPILLPRGGKRQRVSPSLLREICRCAASLELLPAQTKISLGETLLAKVKSRRHDESDLWCLSRLGARELFYAPANHVLPPSAVSLWVRELVPVAGTAECLAIMARQTGDATRNVC